MKIPGAEPVRGTDLCFPDLLLIFLHMLPDPALMSVYKRPDFRIRGMQRCPDKDAPPSYLNRQGLPSASDQLIICRTQSPLNH
jgi:hypothetical protein